MTDTEKGARFMKHPSIPQSPSSDKSHKKQVFPLSLSVLSLLDRDTSAAMSVCRDVEIIRLTASLCPPVPAEGYTA